MDIISFPVQIREYFQQNLSEVNDAKKFIEIFKDATVQQKFVIWAKAHGSLVEYTPRLNMALQLATDDSSAWEMAAQGLHSIYLCITNDGSEKLINSVLACKNKIEPFPDNYALRALELYESGIINFDKLLALLSVQDKFGLCPLHYSAVFEKALPLLEKQTTQNLVALLSIQDKSGLCPLHISDVFEKALPLLEKQKTQNLVALLSIQDKSGRCPLHYPVVFKEALPLLEKQTIQNLVTLLSIQSKYLGRCPLHYPDMLKVALPLLEKKTTQDLVALLSIQNQDGKCPLRFTSIFKDALPLLEKRTTQDLVALLSIQNKDGKCPLHYSKKFKLTLPLLEKLDSKDLVALLTITDKDGKYPLHDIKKIKQALSLLNNLSNEHINQLFSTKYQDIITFLTTPDMDGKCPLHDINTFKQVLPILNSLTDEQLYKLFSNKYNGGNTLLHIPSLSKEAKTLLPRLNSKVFQIQNNAGISIEEMMKNHVDINWLLKNKVTFQSEHLSEKEYFNKAADLRNGIDALWNLFVFSDENEGNVPEEYLTVNIADEIKTFTSQEIKAALDVMIGKIINKKAWLGTPREEDKEALHQFYSQMLNNFDQVATLLAKEESFQKQAGPLIAIAKVELERRCAAAYQSEIEQARMVLDIEVDEKGLEANFNKMAYGSLIACIEKIVQEKYSGNSHTISQMLYSVGLAPSPDPLSNVTIADCQQKIIEEVTKEKLILGFKDSIERLDVESIEQWFTLGMPAEFGERLLKLQAVLQSKEQKIVNKMKIQLQENLNDSLINDALDIFQTTQGAGLKAQSFINNCVSKTVFEKLNNAFTLDDIKEAEALHQQDISKDRLRIEKLLDDLDELKKCSASPEVKKTIDDCQSEMRTLQIKNRGIGIEIRNLLQSANAKVQLGELLKKKHDSLSRQQLNIIMAAKKEFESKIKDLAVKELETEDIAFDPSETGLPSKSVVKARREAYASQFFEENVYPQKINRKGIIEILISMGALENK